MSLFANGGLFENLIKNNFSTKVETVKQIPPRKISYITKDTRIYLETALDAPALLADSIAELGDEFRYNAPDERAKSLFTHAIPIYNPVSKTITFPNFLDFDPNNRYGECGELAVRYIKKFLKSKDINRLNALSAEPLIPLIAKGSAPTHFSTSEGTHTWVGLLTQKQINMMDWAKMLIYDPSFHFLGPLKYSEYKLDVDPENGKANIHPYSPSLESDLSNVIQLGRVGTDYDSSSDNIKPIVLGLTHDYKYSVNIGFGFLPEFRNQLIGQTTLLDAHTRVSYEFMIFANKVLNFPVGSNKLGDKTLSQIESIHKIMSNWMSTTKSQHSSN